MEISVIIPVFNAESYINRAIDSCLLQEQVTEIILIDDGSKDRSYSICEAYKSEYSIIRLFHHANHANLGPAVSRNIGLKHVTKEFFSFLDADDYYLEDRFSLSKEIFKNNPEVDAVYSQVKNKIEDITLRNYPTHIPMVIFNTEIFYNMICGNTSISIISMVIRSSALDNLGFFDSKLKLGQDLDFAFNVAHKTNLKYDEDDNSKIIRIIHSKNRSLAPISDHYKNRKKLFEKWYEKIETESFTKKEKKVLIKNHISYLFLNSKFKKLDSNNINRYIIKSIIFIYLLVKDWKIMHQYF